MKYLTDVTTLSFNRQQCVGCGMCIEVCPHNVFELQQKKATLLDRDACMECGACMRNCPTGAIHVRPGVGCAYAIVLGKLRGTEPTCGCSDDATCCN